MPGDVTHRVFRFGVFEADEGSGELRKHGVRIKLHAQAFKILTMLLERPSAVVTREELRERLWGTDTFVDFDHGLNTAVNKIREALGDSAANPRYVETISGKGYRFVGTVATSKSGSELADDGGQVPAARVRRPAAVPKAGPMEAAETGGTLRVEDRPTGALLTSPHELPAASRALVRTLLLLLQMMYLAFYLGALGNLNEIHEILLEVSPAYAGALMSLVITTGAVLIPIRLFLIAAVAFDFRNLSSKFTKLFPVLLIVDLLWALSPFLLIHHISTGFALGLSAPLVYAPFAQRSLVLMYSREQQNRRREENSLSNSAQS